MNLMKFVITESVTQKLNLPALIKNVSLNFGSVTMTMIVEMTVMSQLIVVDIGTAQKDGDDAQAIQITDVFLNGSSVMVKMTAEMAPMNCQKTVQSVKKREISNAETKGVCLKDGYAILKMIVEIISAYQQDGDVIMMMTVVMEVMKVTA